MPSLRPLCLGLLPFALLACGDDAPRSAPACTLTCEAPPAPRCADADTLTVYAGPGTCADSTCAYPSAEVPCAAGCVERDGVGACAGDPCADVTCDAPPSPCHAATGLCSGGVCTYPVLADAPCDDADPCTTDDTCTATGTCAGAPKVCQTPPESTCEGDLLEVSASAGRCEAGACVYDVTEVPCADGCESGRCNGDPCANVTCDAPPSPCHAEEGTCRDGVCDYAFEDGVACDDANPCTTDDRCGAGQCAGAAVACSTPPTPTCADADTLRSHAATGTCEAGDCAYGEVRVPCAFGCVEINGKGACLGDPCANVTCDEPPRAECEDADTLVTPTAGSCVGGTCTYPTTTTSCMHGCEPGAPNQPARCRAPAGLVIAELRYDSQGFPDTDAFVELHGPAGLTLDGLSLVAVNGNGGADYAVIALAGSLDSAGRFVLAHPSASPEVAAMADQLDAKADLQNGPDSVQLRFGAEVLDALAYGEFGASDTARGEGSPHPGAAVGESLARDHRDTDTNDNAADFTAGAATPGLPTPPPEVAPDVALTCPTVGAPDTALTFDASASTGDIATWRFDFGDGSSATPSSATTTHTFSAAGTYTVTATATSPGGQVDSASCQVLIEQVETPVVYTGTEQCFPTSGATYLYEVVSDPGPIETDLKLTVRYKGLATYGPRPYSIQIQTGANTWSTVFNTNDSKASWQTQHVRIDRATAQAAFTAMGWLRFRWSYLTNGASDNCLQLTLTYNCEACFACPDGMEDLGIDCQSLTAPYDYTILEHPTGRCSSSSRDDLYFPGTPSASGDGTLTLQSLGCGSATARVSIYTLNSGWVELGPKPAGNCSYGSATYTVPKAYLAAGVDPDHRIRFSWSMQDNCAAGTGCANSNDPCVKNMRLTYPR